MICALSNALNRAGSPVTLMTWDLPSSVSCYPLDAGVDWLRLPASSGIGGRLHRTISLTKALYRSRADYVIGFAATSESAIFPACRLTRTRLIAAERNAPSIYHLRNTAPQRRRAMKRLGQAERIVVQLPGFKAGYPARLRDRIVDIPNPVTPATRRARPDRPDAAGRFSLLYTGRLNVRQKRHDLLLDAFAALSGAFPAWDLHLYGRGGYGATIAERARTHGLADRVFIHDPVKDLEPVYTSAHLFVLPSYWEGFSNSLAEALSHGLPAVGFAHAEGVGDLIGETNGWLARGENDLEAYVEVLRAAMGDGAERRRRGEAGARFMRQFEPDRIMDQWRTLLAGMR